LGGGGSGHGVGYTHTPSRSSSLASSQSPSKTTSVSLGDCDSVFEGNDITSDVRLDIILGDVTSLASHKARALCNGREKEGKGTRRSTVGRE
jgi:hypothetical protein